MKTVKPAFSRLHNLYMQHNRERYPHLPDCARVSKKYTDSNANGLTHCIIDWLNMSGWQAERISNTGRYINRQETVTDVIGRTLRTGSGKWIKGSGTNGTADISATVKGMSVKIEIKTGADRQSEAQKQYQKNIEAAGGIYVTARTFDGFLEWYDEFTDIIREV